MGAPLDFSNLLRQKQLMDSLNQTTGQGTGSAMLGGGANLQNLTGAMEQPEDTEVSQDSSGGPLGGLKSKILGGVPGVSQIEQAKPALAGLLQGIGFGSGVPKAGSVYQAPTNTPTLQNRLPPGQPPVQSGQMLTLDSAGNVVVAPHNPFGAPQPVTPFDQNIFNPQAKQYNPSGLF